MHDEIYKLIKEGKTQESCNVVGAEIYRTTRNNKFNECKEYIYGFDFDRLSIQVLLTILTFTYAFHDALLWRAMLYKDIEVILIGRKGRKYAKKLLEGLKEW